MSLIDSHCHLDDEQFDADRQEAIDRALAAGVDQMVVIGTGDGPPDLEAGIRLADSQPPILATIGIHPHHAAKSTDEFLRRLEALVKHPKVVAVGEIGLDYHYDFAPRDRQQAVFVAQIHLARQARKPIVIHTREAWDDTFRLLETHWAPGGQAGIMHCFSGGPAEARRALDMGFLLSFAGIVTYPKATNVQEAARMAPSNRILVETDAPYLAPVPKRGKRNEPAYVVETARRLAALRGIEFEELARATTDNFRRICLPRAAGNG
jgi:TatD DNase family protein